MRTPTAATFALGATLLLPMTTPAAAPVQHAGSRTTYADSLGSFHPWPVGPDDVRHVVRTRSETRTEGKEAVTLALT
jgi:hypothetical protein